MEASELKRTQPTMKTKPPTRQVVGVRVFLVLAVLVVFGQTAHFQFVNYDDEENVYLNPVVAKGLSIQAIGWAFTHAQCSNWIPLTTLSHMLDCQLFGLDAAGHHLVNVMWHAADAVLLFLVLRQMTGSLWRSAFVAAVFAVHPLRAESVAWVSERKDVMSGFFFLLAMGTYVRYARKPSGAAYGLLILWFAMGLLGKNMVATLPFVLLLLDYWPLGRFRDWPQFGALVREKIPLFALSAASCIAAALVPGLIITDSHRLTFLDRIANALVSYVVYLRQMFFPAGLAPVYPILQNGQPLLRVCLALVLLAAISAMVVAWRKQRPYLLIGWLWYLGMLFPVIGIIQISSDASHADRYTYLPEIGVAIAVAWAVAEWSVRWEHRRVVLGAMMGAVIGVLIACGYRQTSYWRTGESLWTREVACTPGNSVAHVYLGAALAREGKAELALEHYRMALAITPDNLAALNNMGTALANNGKVEQAIACFRKSLQIDPASKVTLYNLGVALASNGETEEAIAQYRKALAIDPAFADVHLSLGNALRKSGHIDEAIAQLREVLKIKPDHPAAYSTLGLIFFQQGHLQEAIDCWQRTLAIQPDQTDVQNNLAWLLATTPEASLRDGAKATALAERANHLTGGGNLRVMRTLAAAYAEAGRFGDAAATGRRAMELGAAQKDQELTKALEREIKLYDSKMPLREVSK